MVGDLLQTKLYVPKRPHGRQQHALVPRPRLIEKLNAGLDGKLTLISAPAGFGKTTLVTEAIHDAPSTIPNPQFAWLSLDEEDSDPVRFLRYFIAALQTIHTDLGEEILRNFASTQPPPLKTAVSTLINELSSIPDHIIFVLDDYHLIRSEAIDETLAYFLQRQPPHFHLVITTREDPPIPLPRWRARGELTEIRERDLRFTTAETTLLLNDILGLNLSAVQIEKLESKTEGWISGLQLAALSLRGQPNVDQFVNAFAGSNRFILDYLIEEVFRQQPPDVREFLLQTAVLDQLTAPLCDAVMSDEETAVANSQTMLERLEQANLFIIPLDESRQWFRYHHLFADLLRRRLRLEMGETAVLHHRAACWHETNDFPRRAINHYLAAAAWEEAADLIFAQSDALQKHGENITFLRWMSALPDSVIKSNPDLCLEYAWALALNSQADAADSYLQLAEEAFRNNPARHSTVLSAQIHVARIRHDLSQTISLSQRALSLIPPTAYDPRSALSLNLGIAHWQSGQIGEAEAAFSEAQEMARLAQNHHVRLLAIGFMSMVQAALGRLQKAADLLQAALEWGADLPASGLPHLVWGALCYEWNRLEDAGSHLQKAIDLAQRSGNSELESSAYRQWALLKQSEGDSTAALVALAQAESAAGKSAPPLTHAVAVTIALAQHNLETAQTRVEKMETAAAASPFYVPLFLAPAHLALAQGNTTAAVDHLAAEFDKADRSGWRYGQIEIRLLQALAAADANDGLIFLTDALTMAQPEGFVRIFLDKGEGLIPLLHISASKQVLPDYARKLLALFAGAAPETSIQTVQDRDDFSLIEAVSEREIEVLQLLADGRTYQEISQAMVVSINTVNSHLKTIYGKLGVHNRREAVAQARVPHLISPDK